MMKNILPVLSLLLAFANQAHAGGHSVALIFETKENVDCRDDDQFLSETAIAAFGGADVAVSESVSSWEEVFGELGTGRALGESEDVDGDFLDVMDGASPGHRRLCDKDCRRLCISSSYSFAAACACCSCCNGRRRLSFSTLRKLSEEDLGVLAHDAAKNALDFLQSGDSDVRIPACVARPLHVEAVIQETDGSGREARGVAGMHSGVSDNQNRGGRGFGNNGRGNGAGRE
ncbi:expressed unknown protein [Seminavis robusta]|uniref:Uncharacterized protein n=1 Tax=Seminavis robusta TaxID=568900 RepID=A0A9N8H597_9STRA|nr:expressed unknown protein [Seminavis robusta]|eukprot:Sro69_g038430.1 n/a (231) ;mRNA; r:16976-17668